MQSWIRGKTFSPGGESWLLWVSSPIMEFTISLLSPDPKIYFGWWHTRKMSPPLVALWYTTECYFLHNTYHLWKWSCLCTCFLPPSLLFMEYKQNGVVGGLLCFVCCFISSSYDSTRLLSVYLWNEWVDGLINTLMAHYFLSHTIPKPHGDSWLMLLPALQNPVIHCHVYGHDLCIPTCPPSPLHLHLDSLRQL